MGGTQMNVYQALRERIGRIFGEYDYVYLSFSGGKDSGVLLNAVWSISGNMEVGWGYSIWITKCSIP